MFNESQMDTLEWIVMKLLNAKYEDIHGKVSVKNNTLVNTYQEERNKIVDLLVNYNGLDILIELNNNHSGNYMRNLLYAFNIISNHYNRGVGSYEIIKNETRIILVNLNWHRKGFNYHKILAKEEDCLKYPDYDNKDYLIKIININLDFYYELCYHKVKESDKIWKLFTIDKENDLNSLVAKETLLNSYQKKLLYLSDSEEYKKMIMNEDIERNALWEQNHSYDFKCGIKKGMIEGNLTAKKEMIINMHKKNIPIELISECSKLTIEEINKILSDVNND